MLKGGMGARRIHPRLLAPSILAFPRESVLKHQYLSREKGLLLKLAFKEAALFSLDQPWESKEEGPTHLRETPTPTVGDFDGWVKLEN